MRKAAASRAFTVASIVACQACGGSETGSAPNAGDGASEQMDSMSALNPMLRGELRRSCERTADGDIIEGPELPDVPCGDEDLAYMGPAGLIWNIIAERESEIAAAGVAPRSQGSALVTGRWLFDAQCPMVEYEVQRQSAYSFTTRYAPESPSVALGLIGDLYEAAAATARLCETTPERRLEGVLWALYRPEQDQRIVAVELGTDAVACALSIQSLRETTLTHDTVGEGFDLDVPYPEDWVDDDDNVIQRDGPPYDAYLLASTTSQRCQTAR